MGNQAHNQQYALNKNWINANGNNMNNFPPQSHQSMHTDTQKQGLQQSNYISQLKGHQMPVDARNSASRIGSSPQPHQPNIATLRHSAIDMGTKHPSSFIGSDKNRLSSIDLQIASMKSLQQLPPVKLVFKPELCKSGSIVQKTKKINSNFRLDTLTQQIDDIRVAFRKAQLKMSEDLDPVFENDILQMNDMIQKQRQSKMKDKNKVIYLLKQKKHYHKLCLKFKDYDQKIKQFLLTFRKKDSIHQITQQQLFAALQLKAAVESVVSSIQKDLPSKGWKAVLEQPGSKNYLSVVTSGMQDPQIMGRVSELEQSLTNPQILQQITNEEMMHSVTRRIGGQSTQQTAKKLIQGPAHYNNTAPLRGSRFPFPS